MRKLIAPLLFLLAVLFALPAQAQMACPDPFSARGPCAAVTASATGTTGVVTATLPAAAGKTTYVCSVQIGEAGPAATTTATATNTITGTLNYVVTAPGNFTVTYTPCVPANAQNTTIPVSAAANGTATNVAVTATGYQL